MPSVSLVDLVSSESSSDTDSIEEVIDDLPSLVQKHFKHADQEHSSAFFEDSVLEERLSTRGSISIKQDFRRIPILSKDNLKRKKVVTIIDNVNEEAKPESSIHEEKSSLSLLLDPNESVATPSQIVYEFLGTTKEKENESTRNITTFIDSCDKIYAENPSLLNSSRLSSCPSSPVSFNIHEPSLSYNDMSLLCSLIDNDKSSLHGESYGGGAVGGDAEGGNHIHSVSYSDSDINMSSCESENEEKNEDHRGTVMSQPDHRGTVMSQPDHRGTMMSQPDHRGTVKKSIVVDMLLSSDSEEVIEKHSVSIIEIASEEESEEVQRVHSRSDELAEMISGYMLSCSQHESKRAYSPTPTPIPTPIPIPIPIPTPIPISSSSSSSSISKEKRRCIVNPTSSSPPPSPPSPPSPPKKHRDVISSPSPPPPPSPSPSPSPSSSSLKRTPLSPPSSPIKKSRKSPRHTTLLLSLEEQLARSDIGRSILSTARTEHVIGPDLKCPVHGVLVVMRQVNDEYVPIRDCVVVVMNGNAMISLIKDQGLEDALQHVREIRNRLVESPKQKLLLILTEMQAIIAEQRKKRRESILSFTHDFLTELYIRLRLDCNITCFPCESSTAVVEWVMKILRAIRDCPYQQPLTELGVMNRMKVSGSVERIDSNSALVIWQRLLQCIPGVSASKAVAVTRFYPTLSCLLDEYRRCNDEEERLNMLTDRFGGNTKQKQLSRKVYESLVVTDPSYVI